MRQAQPGDNGWDTNLQHTQADTHAISKGRLMLQRGEVQRFCLHKAHSHPSCCGLHHARQIVCQCPWHSVVHFLGSVIYPSCMNLLDVIDNLLVMSKGSTENTDF